MRALLSVSAVEGAIRQLSYPTATVADQARIRPLLSTTLPSYVRNPLATGGNQGPDHHDQAPGCPVARFEESILARRAHFLPRLDPEEHYSNLMANLSHFRVSNSCLVPTGEVSGAQGSTGRTPLQSEVPNWGTLGSKRCKSGEDGFGLG